MCLAIVNFHAGCYVGEIGGGGEESTCYIYISDEGGRC